jgi:hypothetical protein
MSKNYFEMNDKERQLRHIGETIDYAISMFSEGLSGTGEYNIPNKEVIELQSKISGQLIDAHASIEKLMKEVKEEEEIINNNSIEDDEVQFDHRLVSDKKELAKLTGYSILSVIETHDEDDRQGCYISLGKLQEDGAVYASLILSGNGNVYIHDGDMEEGKCQ